MTDFPSGCIVYFRERQADGLFIRETYPNARTIIAPSPEILALRDETFALVGVFAVSAIITILPLQTVGPGAFANAGD